MSPSFGSSQPTSSPGLSGTNNVFEDSFEVGFSSQFTELDPNQELMPDDFTLWSASHVHCAEAGGRTGWPTASDPDHLLRGGEYLGLDRHWILDSEDAENIQCSSTCQDNDRLGWGTPFKQNDCRSAAAMGKRRKTADANEKGNGMNLLSPRLRTSRRYSSTRVMFNLNLDTKKSSPLGNIAKHNQTEKRYRSRLNDKFETLLSVLPKDMIIDVSSAGSEHAARKISKAEVLVLAKARIRALEKATEDLEGENEVLAHSAEKMGNILRLLERQEQA